MSLNRPRTGRGVRRECAEPAERRRRGCPDANEPDLRGVRTARLGGAGAFPRPGNLSLDNYTAIDSRIKRSIKGSHLSMASS